MKRRNLISLAIAGLLLAGCGSGTSDNYSESEAPGGYVLFRSDTGNIPYPNNILIDRTTGKLALPTDPADADYVVKSALNTLDGFSTTSPISVGVSTEIDPASLTGKVLVVDGSSGTPLRAGQDFVTTYTNGKIVILPTKPLSGGTNYIVALLKGITSTDGKPIVPDFVTASTLDEEPLLDDQGNPTIVLSSDPVENLTKVKRLEALRQLNDTLIRAIGVPRNDLLDIWSFKTQTIGTLAQAFAKIDYNGAKLGLVDTKLTSKAMLLAAGYDVNKTMKGIAEVYAGTLAGLPYYLGIPSTTDPTAPLTGHFHFEGNDSLPVAEANLTIPVLATIPSASSGCTMPANGWPVVIFQHGITQNRTNLLPISEAFASVCYAAVAIDLPLHGITDKNNKLYMEYNATTHAGERTFDMDFVTQDAEGHIVAAQPDGIIDSSGIHYINLRSLLTSRDNIRQSTSDFIALLNAMAAPAVAPDGTKFDTQKVAYVGHSLGAMAPFGFLANRTLASVVLANPGGGIAQLLNHSETFGPIIQEGLASAGIQPGSPEYDAFMMAAQTILDDADPINYAAAVTANNQKLLTFETLGDQVIPNAVATAPLSGTEPLLAGLGAKTFDLNDANATGFIGLLPQTSTVTKFTAGTHSSLLDPGDTPEVTIEMQTETASFTASRGAGIQTTPYAPAVIEQP